MWELAICICACRNGFHHENELIDLEHITMACIVISWFWYVCKHSKDFHTFCYFRFFIGYICYISSCFQNILTFASFYSCLNTQKKSDNDNAVFVYKYNKEMLTFNLWYFTGFTMNSVLSESIILFKAVFFFYLII